MIPKAEFLKNDNLPENSVRYIENSIGVLVAIGNDGELFRFKNSQRKPDTITFYKESGEIIKTQPLFNRSYHSDRCLIAERNGIDNWHHYSMHDTLSAMTKEGDAWYDIDPLSGMLNGATRKKITRTEECKNNFDIPDMGMIVPWGYGHIKTEWNSMTFLLKTYLGWDDCQSKENNLNTINEKVVLSRKKLTQEINLIVDGCIFGVYDDGYLIDYPKIISLILPLINKYINRMVFHGAWQKMVSEKITYDKKFISHEDLPKLKDIFVEIIFSFNYDK